LHVRSALLPSHRRLHRTHARTRTQASARPPARVRTLTDHTCSARRSAARIDLPSRGRSRHGAAAGTRPQPARGHPAKPQCVGIKRPASGGRGVQRCRGGAARRRPQRSSGRACKAASRLARGSRSCAGAGAGAGVGAATGTRGCLSASTGGCAGTETSIASSSSPSPSLPTKRSSMRRRTRQALLPRGVA
jgi:hypothetical protein